MLFSGTTISHNPSTIIGALSFTENGEAYIDVINEQGIITMRSEVYPCSIEVVTRDYKNNSSKQ